MTADTAAASRAGSFRNRPAGRPRSLAARLLIIAALSTAAALGIAAWGIGTVLDRFVIGAMDQRLDLQLVLLSRALRSDGRLDEHDLVQLPGFGAGGGWFWQVSAPDGRHWHSEGAPPLDLPRRLLQPPPPGPPLAGQPPISAGNGVAVGPPAPPGSDSPEGDSRPPPPGPGIDRPRPGDATAPDGSRLHLRVLERQVAGGVAVLAAAGPKRVAEAPLRDAIVPLLLSLALLGVGLAAATVVQLRVGLRPVRRLPGAIEAVMAGQSYRVPTDQPAELRPLAVAVNALIERNEQGLDHARRHVANLAHGLKTPMARIALLLEENGSDGDGKLRALLADADRRIAHHLRRARAAAPGGVGRTRTALEPALRDIAAVLERVHGGRAPTVEIGVAAGTGAVAVDAQDLDEMLGNLLDNACRHARRRVSVAVRAAGSGVEISVADDGAGLDPAALARLGRRGVRLDEQEPDPGGPDRGEVQASARRSARTLARPDGQSGDGQGGDGAESGLRNAAGRPPRDRNRDPHDAASGPAMLAGTNRTDAGRPDDGPDAPGDDADRFAPGQADGSRDDGSIPAILIRPDRTGAASEGPKPQFPTPDGIGAQGAATLEQDTAEGGAAARAGSDRSAGGEDAGAPGAVPGGGGRPSRGDRAGADRVATAPEAVGRETDEPDDGRKPAGREEGWGFGLSITRELAELYGGGLRLSSGTRLSGLEAVLLLPAARQGSGAG
ncbi:ATP-binding protein [Rhizosaccharibacter radicis]|uniref:histidine kinase n=1 Tax=Rhizosaccharibacter radicis TaxID=2782605 RepID=A0ABT1VZC4_9PROT|nr:sensor histidine kinase [Acetobacteraceae bacterium KSS12]